MIEIKVLGPPNWNRYNKQLQELENLAEYPYGSDFFRISHGPSYFQFFERLGETVFHIGLYNEKVIACSAGILRRIPRNGQFLKAWYLCDLKVHPAFRGKHLPSLLFRKNLIVNYLRCGRGYAISMNPLNAPNRVVGLMKKFSWLPFNLVGQLNFYNLNWRQMNECHQTLEKILGPISYLSLEGKKDLIMRSTNERMKLLHIQHGPLAEAQIHKPQEDAVHMICALQESPLDHFLRSQADVMAQASIIAHRMKSVDWKFILTSDI